MTLYATRMSEYCPSTSEPCDGISKRRIQSHKKSRGGCFTCKARRKKCDEARPSCRRCVNTGRKCDGYSVSRAETQQQKMRHLPISGGDLAVQGYGWTFLEYFRFRTIPIFSNYYDSTLWEVILAQTSVSQATLQYTAVAFAATHHEYETRWGDPTKRLVMDGQKSAVATLYIDAVSKARQALAKASSTAEAVRTGFIMSFMLAATECLRNSTEGTTMHLANGLKIAFSQGYETINTSWKPCEPDLTLNDAVLAFIQNLQVTIEKELDLISQGHQDTEKSMCNPCTGPCSIERPPHPFRSIYLEISGLVDHLVIWRAKTPVPLSEASVFSATLELFSHNIRRMSLHTPNSERRKLRFIRLYREAVHLLLLCHINDLTACDSTSYSQRYTSPESRLKFLKAYFSKLSIIEESLRREDAFITHLSPAQLKRFATKYSLISPSSTSHLMYRVQEPTPLHILYGEIEQLVMLQDDAIVATGLVPADATCMEVKSALEQGTISIQYCIVRPDAASFEWVEKIASLWKPAIFKEHRIN